MVSVYTQPHSELQLWWQHLNTCVFPLLHTYAHTHCQHITFLLAHHGIILALFIPSHVLACMHACMHAYCTGASNGRPPVIGYTAYRFTYSTWEGRVVHVEDLFVEEQYRGEEVIRKCLLGHV